MPVTRFNLPGNGELISRDVHSKGTAQPVPSASRKPFRHDVWSRVQRYQLSIEGLYPPRFGLRQLRPFLLTSLTVEFDIRGTTMISCPLKGLRDTRHMKYTIRSPPSSVYIASDPTESGGYGSDYCIYPDQTLEGLLGASRLGSTTLN